MNFKPTGTFPNSDFDSFYTSAGHGFEALFVKSSANGQAFASSRCVQ